MRSASVFKLRKTRKLSNAPAIALYESLVEARRSTGNEEPFPFHRFAQMVKAQVTKLQEGGNQEVAFRVAVKDNKVVMQLGHHYNSLPTFHKAREIYRSGALGKVPLIRLYIDRAGATPEWKLRVSEKGNGRTDGGSG